MEELGKLRSEGESLHQKIHDLDQQLRGAQDEIASHGSEMETLKQRLKEAENSAG